MGFAELISVGASVAFVAGAAATTPAGSSGDVDAGWTIYSRCVACHALAHDRTGPRHCGLFGGRAGAVAGFDYSAAMKSSTIVWNAKALDRFLADVRPERYR